MGLGAVGVAAAVGDCWSMRTLAYWTGGLAAVVVEPAIAGVEELAAAAVAAGIGVDSAAGIAMGSESS